MSLTTYSKDEIVSVSELARHLKKMMDALASKKKVKFGIVKNNKIKAALVSTEFLEELEELIEHMEIYQIAQKRKNEKATIILEELEKEYKIKPDKK